MKLKIFKLLSLFSLLVVSSSSWAFNSGDVIAFDPGVEEEICLIPDYPQLCIDLPFLMQTEVHGSYFALDLNHNGRFDTTERVAITPGADGGIVIGQTQPASSGYDCINNQGTGGVDEFWCILNRPGWHQTTMYPVIDNGNGTLDFRGWGVSWGGLSDISLGGEPLVGDTGLATLTCSSTPCSPNDLYTIDYTASIPFDDLNFAGLRYQLHLEHDVVVPQINVSISLNGGSVQECSSTNGHDVSALANIQLINGATLDTINWTVDGVDVGAGETITSFMSLGVHTVNVTAIAITGQQGTATTTVNVVDTTAPVISSAYIDKRSGSEISSIESKNTSFVGVSISAADVCDALPSIQAIGGFSLKDGDTLKIQGNLDKIELMTTALEMQVRAIDVSGNSSEKSKTLSITP